MAEIDTARLDILVARYLGEAEACRQMAVTIQPTDRDVWLFVSAGWIRLAEEAQAKARSRLH
jgi:hypothetical protein